jgi:hypothetical protein
MIRGGAFGELEAGVQLRRLPDRGERVTEK